MVLIHPKRSVIALILLMVVLPSEHSTNAKKCDKRHGPETDGCAVARCVAPPTGCSLVTEYKRASGDDESCCPVLCLSRDANGKKCNFSTNGKKCDKRHGPKTDGCAVAKCVAPPTGCSLVTEYKRASGDDESCCPVLCLSRDANGKKCKFKKEELRTCYKNKKCKFKTCGKNCKKRVCTSRSGCDVKKLQDEDKKSARKNCMKQVRTCEKEKKKCPKKLPDVGTSCTKGEQEYRCIGSPGRCCELDLYGRDIRCWMECAKGVWQEECGLD